jgi:hypothetical protein
MYPKVRPGTRLRVGLLAAASLSILNTNWYKLLLLTADGESPFYLILRSWFHKKTPRISAIGCTGAFKIKALPEVLDFPSPHSFSPLHVAAGQL